jgi:hypothetical protein
MSDQPRLGYTVEVSTFSQTISRMAVFESDCVDSPCHRIGHAHRVESPASEDPPTYEESLIDAGRGHLLP